LYKPTPKHRDLLEERYRALEARAAATRQVVAAASPRTTARATATATAGASSSLAGKLLSPQRGAASPVRRAAPF
jgi:hypothetical protein